MSGTLNFIIEYQPQLLEEAVLRAIAGHAKEQLFRSERDEVYRLGDEEAREEAFQTLAQQWFEQLGLSAPLREVLGQWPILNSSTGRCVVTKARSLKEMCAEMYVAAAKGSEAECKRRSIVIQLTPEILIQPTTLLTFLRRELLHIADMLDPQFGYQPNFPPSEAGPTYDHFLQERYRILWNITIDGRLYHRGWLPPSVKETQWGFFKNVFSGEPKELEAMFSYFFDTWPHTHSGMVSFARSPECWLVDDISEASTRGRCSLCNFPSFELIRSPLEKLPGRLLAGIQQDYPSWNPQKPLCRQCVYLYNSHSSQF